MTNFAKFVQQAMPEVERVANEMAEHFGTLKHPLDECFKFELISYYADGRIYESHRSTVWAGTIQDRIDEAAKYKWTVSFDPETKVFRFEKHFANGMYRIATYTPYSREKLDIAVTA